MNTCSDMLRHDARTYVLEDTLDEADHAQGSPLPRLRRPPGPRRGLRLLPRVRLHPLLLAVTLPPQKGERETMSLS